LTPQQEKMKACNAQAGDKKLEGNARKAFMSDCLKAGTPATQQGKMKARNKDASAKALKGEERKAFMSTCLASEKKSEPDPPAHPVPPEGRGETPALVDDGGHRWRPRLPARAPRRRAR
jgi:psiF repeat